MTFAALALAAALGFTLAHVLGRLRLAREAAARELAEGRAASAEAELTDARRTLASTREALIRADEQGTAERRHADEKLALLGQAEKKLTDTFQALAVQALAQSQEQARLLSQSQLQTFQEGARGDLLRRQQAIDALVKPVSDQLEKLQGQLQSVEKDRVGAQSALIEQVRALQAGQGKLETATSHLTQALRAPQTRGRWGEVQLRRVVELSGMIEHCDFVEQFTVTTEEGQLRPDVLVRLPGERLVVIDAKAPLAAYLDAIAATDDTTRAARLVDHGRQVRDHATKLGKKAYAAQFKTPGALSPELVVMFIPNDGACSAALEQVPDLFETALAEDVLIATPNNLIALLRTIELGWRQEKLAENAARISDLGRELHKRVAKLGDHLETLGKRLGDAVEAYNGTVGSLEQRVLPKAREFEALGASNTDVVIPALRLVEVAPRPVRAPELLPPAPSEEAN